VRFPRAPHTKGSRAARRINALTPSTLSRSDWGDLVEYLYGDENTFWGAVRIHNDTHPAPYNISTFELGNEQENFHFLEQLRAVEARRALIPGAPEWTFLYPENSGPNASTMAAIVAAGIDPRRVTADCHVGASGGVACAERSVPWQFGGSGINCETNAVTSHLQRGVEEAADLITWFSQPANVSARLIARTASFCIQRSGQMRDIWDQGLSFFLPNMTWLQPPGVVHALFSQHWTPNALSVATTGGGGFVSAAAQIAEDRSYVAVELVNAEWGAAQGSASVAVSGFSPAATVDFYLVAEPGDGAVNSTAGNTPANPQYIQVVHSTLAWPPSGNLTVVLPPLSVAVLVLHAA
jgi:alpha-L-arabinofuranosidase